MRKLSNKTEQLYYYNYQHKGSFSLPTAFGIWEVVDSVDEIKNGSDLADEFRKIADEFQQTVDSLMALDQEMQS